MYFCVVSSSGSNKNPQFESNLVFLLHFREKLPPKLSVYDNLFSPATLITEQPIRSWLWITPFFSFCVHSFTIILYALPRPVRLLISKIVNLMTVPMHRESSSRSCIEHIMISDIKLSGKQCFSLLPFIFKKSKQYQDYI